MAKKTKKTLKSLSPKSATKASRQAHVRLLGSINTRPSGKELIGVRSKGAAMADKKTRERAKREIVVLEEDGDQYATTKIGFASTAEARKWILGTGESLAGKTLRIASLSEPMVILVETVSKVSFE